MSHKVRGVRLPPEVQTATRAMHPELRRRVHTALDHIQTTPQSGKLLKRELSVWQSFPVGRLRIIDREIRGMIEIGAIGPRASIYLDATQRLSRSR